MEWSKKYDDLREQHEVTIKANIEKMLVQPPPLPPLAVEPMITDKQPQFSEESELESDSKEVIYNVKVILKEIEGEKQEERMFCGENFKKEVEVVEEGESEEEMGERSEELENNIAGDATLSRDYNDEGREKQTMEIAKLTEENRRCLLCSSKHEFSEQCPFSEKGVTI